MEFTALRYFHEAARTGSIRRASEILHVTPSSVSRAVSALEHEFGAPLFERGAKGVTLTAAGTLLARQTGSMFRNLDRVRDSIDDLRGLNRGKVILYGAEGLVAEFLPRVIHDFRARHPQIGFDIHFDSTDAIVAAVLDDVADIGITFNGPQRLDIATLAEYTEPLCCIVQPNHPLEARASDGAVKLADLVDMPLALPETSFGMRRMVDKAFSGASSRPRIVINTNSLELTKRVAMEGDAVAFMPTFMVRDEIAAGRLSALRVLDPAFQEAKVSLCVHRDRELSFAAKALVETLSRHFRDLQM
ncbi:LysR family transcriptional regulator [Rhodobacterales bacterium]|nr:LysR family transcriptional regulator [Rhodobacterales bacterium]